MNTSDYETDDITLENLEPVSPRSQGLRDFENYSQTALPLLVEANLRAIVETQNAPIEERVRAMFVNIVRTCQSTVARNFHLTVSQPSSANGRMQSSSQTIAPAETNVHTRTERGNSSRDDTTDDSLDFSREPPHLNAEVSAPFLGPLGNVTGSQGPNSDSGFESSPFSCACSCHDYSNTWNVANGKKFPNIVSNHS